MTKYFLYVILAFPALPALFFSKEFLVVEWDVREVILSAGLGSDKINVASGDILMSVAVIKHKYGYDHTL